MSKRCLQCYGRKLQHEEDITTIRRLEELYRQSVKTRKSLETELEASKLIIRDQSGRLAKLNEELDKNEQG